MLTANAPSGGRFGDLRAIIAALTLVQMASAAIGLAIPLMLREAGATSFGISLVMACYMAGFLAGACFAPARIEAIGHIRAFVFFAASACFAVLAMAVSGTLAWLAPVEFFLGLAVAGLYATGESWIADAAPAKGRGRLLSQYYLIAKAGVMGGPFLVAGMAGQAGSYMVVAALLCLAIMPVAATRHSQPSPQMVKGLSVRALWRAAPGGVQAAFVAGFANGAILQLYPVYLQATPSTGTIAGVAAFNAFAQAGALIAQWPAGGLSDRIDRRVTIAALASLGAIAAGAIALFGQAVPLWILLALAAFWGAGSLTFYAIAVAHATDRVNEGESAGAIAGLLIVWGAGAVIGPVIAGALMTGWLGPAGLFALSAAALAALTLAMLYRRRVQDPTPFGDKERFGPVSTTSIGIAEIDPRGAAALAEGTPRA